MDAQGASRNVTFQEWDKIWNINKKAIDPVCPRHTAVVCDQRVSVELTNHATTEVVTIPRHKKYPPAGVKTTMRTRRYWRCVGFFFLLLGGMLVGVFLGVAVVLIGDDVVWGFVASGVFCSSCW